LGNIYVSSNISKEREREEERKKFAEKERERATTKPTTTTGCTRYHHHLFLSFSATNVFHLFSVPFLLLFS
jgi:hypothetical protein